MLSLIVAAALIAAPPGDETTGKVLVDVCLPFVAGGDEQAGLDALRFTLSSEDGAERDLESSDGSYGLKLLDDDASEDDGVVQRSCTLQARRTNFDRAEAAIRGPLAEAGFTLESGQPANRPIWSRGGTSISLRQNEGRATVMRVSYSSLDE